MSIEQLVIPPMVVGPVTKEQDSVLLWVHTGAATVEAAGITHRLRAGDAIWLPPGVERCTRTEAGAVVFPVLLRPAELTGALAEVHVVSIPPGWEDWLIHRWDDNSYTRDDIPGAGALLRVVAEAPSPQKDVVSTQYALPLPRSREALGAARAILRNPSSSQDIETLASLELVSAKTLQRQFPHETGLTFSEWRTCARVAIAATHLAEGQTVTWTARQVGYATSTGFARAFRRHTGFAPREYARRYPTSSGSDPRGAGEPADQTAIPTADAPERPAPRVPARTFWDVVRPRHELMWVYRGTVTLRIGTRELALSQGQGIWVPAGVPHSVEHATGSLLLTIGIAHGRIHCGVDELTVYTFLPEAESFLLHTMLAEFSCFRPKTGADEFTRMLFREQFGSPRVSQPGLTGAIGEIAQALHRDPADSRSLASWAARLRTTPQQLGHEMLAQTGDTFPQWRARIRMDAARQRLLLGETPGQVARQLSYASPATFTRAFTTAHGLSPRQYQRREGW